MTPAQSYTGIPQLSAPAGDKTAQAKARLLNWAEESDARSRATRSSLGSIATIGGMSLLGGISLARVLSPRRPRITAGARVASVGARLVSWALVARVGQLLLPYAVSAAHTAIRRRAAR